MFKGIHHTGITVPDLDKAIHYYVKTGGFTLVHQFSLENTDKNRTLMGVENACSKAAWLRGPTGYLELFEFDSPTINVSESPAVNDTGIRHICLQAQDGDQLFDLAEEHGASSHARPTGLGTGNLYVYIRDPFGNVLELEGLPYAPAEESDTWYAHTALVVNDMEKMLSFYEALSGIKRTRETTVGPAKPFDTVSGFTDTKIAAGWIHVPNGNIEFWRYLNPISSKRPAAKASDIGYTHVCYEVDDVVEAVKALKTIGTRFVSEPSISDTISLVYGLDPEDNLFELIEFKGESRAHSLDNITGKDFLVKLAEAAAIHYRAGGS